MIKTNTGNLPKDQVLRYLGRRGQEITPQLDAIIEECMDLMGTVQPRHTDRLYSLETGRPEINPSPGEARPSGAHPGEARPSEDLPGVLFVPNTQVTLPGKSIHRHLSGCSHVVLMAVTLGIAADTLIRHHEHTDMTRALVLDACATQHIESACDILEQRICREARDKGLRTTPRFSPGYGDLPLEIQPQLLTALDAERRIGLTCTPNMILLPRKSVTAIIGLGENPDPGPKYCKCEACGLAETCSYS
ncbi:MAG: methionine synthase [Peptococcaceae bacterium]|nr:methionine synthase [Peptococcaceae bacterium]